jgi:hypothetical protein
MAFYSSNATLRNITIEKNSANTTGGVSFSKSLLTLQNGTFLENESKKNVRIQFTT